MMILVSAVIAVLSAQTAFAEKRINRPFNTTNGRTTVSAPAGPKIFVVSTPGGGASSNSGAPDAAATQGAVSGTGGRSEGRSGRGVRHGGKTFWGAKTHRIDAGGAGAGAGGSGGATTTTTSAEEAPPNFSKPGALIRDTGQQPVYEKTTTRTHTVDAGEIALNVRKSIDVGRAPSVQHGPKDTLPPPNPGTYTRSGTGGAAANSPTSGSSSGGNNNGSGNNDKNMPGDDKDGKGNDKTFDDPTGFNSAF